MKTILTVDDSPQDAELLAYALQDAGIRNPYRHVLTCLEGMAYLRGAGTYADRQKYPLPSVIFMDLKLPVMDGYDFLKWVKSDPGFSKILLIALSGANELGYARRACELGANMFIAKPCRESDLEALASRFPGYWEQTPAPQAGMTPA